MAEERGIDSAQFLTRTIVAVLGAAAIVWVVYAPAAFGVGFFGLLAALGFVEASRLTFLAVGREGTTAGADSAAIIGPALGLIAAPILVFGPDLFLGVISFLTIASLYRRALLHLLYPLQVIAAFLSAIKFLLDGAPDVIMTLLISIWATDIGAYLIGMKFGRRRLAPIISPKKSWEGAIGGAVFGIITGWAAGAAFGSAWNGIVLGMLGGIAGQIGDLAESALKRSAGVKDSSRILPGHGGILDRFDSFILCAPMAQLILG